MNWRCFATWFDKRDLLSGEDWEFVIKREIKRASLLITCLSSNSVDRTGFFQKELRLAIEQAELRPPGKIFIVPIRLNSCPIRPNIEHLHVTDMFEKSPTLEDSPTFKLLRAIKKGLDDAGMPYGARAPKEEHLKLIKAIEDYNSGRGIR